MILSAIFFVIFLGFFLQFKRFFQPIKFCQSRKKLDGKTVIITGGNSGIGFETALDLASRNARVIIASENYKDCLRAVVDITRKTSNQNVVAKFLDLSDLNSVRKFTKHILEKEGRLDILVNNAGTLTKMDKNTSDNLPWVLQVKKSMVAFVSTEQVGSTYSHALKHGLALIRTIWARGQVYEHDYLLKKSAPSKIVNISSSMHRFGFLNFDNIKSLPTYAPNFFHYCNSKLLILYTTWAFSEKLKNFGVTVNCIHPGIVKSNIFYEKVTDFWTKVALNFVYYYLRPWTLKTFEGAQTTIHCSVCEKTEKISGEYFKNCQIAKTYVKKDPVKIQKIWDQSVKLVGLQENEIKI